MALTEKQRKARKAAYDRQYRERNQDRIRVNKSAYFQRTYDPIKAAKERKKTMPQHLEYCRQPKYKAYKRQYDKQRKLAAFGSFCEAYTALRELQKEIRKQMPDRFERYAQAGRKQWNPLTQQRRKRGNPIDAIDSY